MVHDVEVEPVALADRVPVGDARAAERIDADVHARGAHGLEVDDRGEVGDVRIAIRRAARVVAALRARSNGTRATPWRPSASRAFAFVSIQPVTSVSAGPPWGGLYLKPPYRGGLCDGVTTMPSARPPRRPRLYVRIAWEMTGVGV